MSTGNKGSDGLPSCYFGKLPISAEFIRRTSGVPELRHLDTWLERGMHLGAQEGLHPWRRRFDQVASTRFLYACKETGALLGGVCCFSRDRAGRRYPFILGTRAEQGSVNGAFPCLPVGMSRYMTDAMSVVESGWEGRDLRSFRALLRDLQWERDDDAARVRLTESFHTRKASDLWRATLAEPGRFRATMLLFALHTLAQCGSSRRMVMRVPTSGAWWEIGFWFALARSWTGLGAHPTLSVWDGDGEPHSGILRLVFGRLAPEHFEPVFWPTHESDFAHDLASERKWTAREISVAKRRYEPLAELDGTVADLLGAVAEAGGRGQRRCP